MANCLDQQPWPIFTVCINNSSVINWHGQVEQLECWQTQSPAACLASCNSFVITIASTRILRTSSYLGTKFSRSILARNGDSIGYLYCSGGISNDEPKHIWKEYFQVALSIKPTEPAAVAAEGAADYRPSIRVQANLSNLNLHKWHKSKRKALFFANIPKKKPNKFLPVAFTVNH